MGYTAKHAFASQIPGGTKAQDTFFKGVDRPVSEDTKVVVKTCVPTVSVPDYMLPAIPGETAWQQDSGVGLASGMLECAHDTG